MRRCAGSIVLDIASSSPDFGAKTGALIDRRYRYVVIRHFDTMSRFELRDELPTAKDRADMGKKFRTAIANVQNLRNKHAAMLHHLGWQIRLQVCGIFCVDASTPVSATSEAVITGIATGTMSKS